MASNANKGAMAVPLLGLTINWITLQTFRKHPYLIVGNWTYLCSDLLVTCVVVTTLPSIFSGGLSLSLAYVIASSVLIGLISRAFWASLWSVGVTLALALLKLHNTSLSTVVAASMVAGIIFSVLVGNRLNSQFAEISRLSAEAAFARAEERALTERLTIARDLHDSLAKSVHGIRMLAETLDSSLASEHHPDTQLSHLIFESADEASREARLVLDGLRSGGDNDTIGALQEEVNRWGARTGITISTNRTESQPPLPCSTETMWQLQRMVGEILTNIEKHAQATSINVDFFYDSAHFYLDIYDDGIGFDNSLGNLNQEGHYGLTGLKERTKSLGGHISIDPHFEFGGGTRISFQVPIDSLGTHKEKST
jgi:ATP-binding region, ATPase-like